VPQTFDFPYHRVQTEHPESSVQVRFGKGYQFASRPVGPNQLTLRLSFKKMFYFQNAAGVFVPTLEPQLNMLALEQFYEAHQLFEKFYYQHPTRGQLTCRFLKPLVTPKSVDDELVILPGGERQHGVEAFDLQFITQP
jgi:phage-related protein